VSNRGTSGARHRRSGFSLGGDTGAMAVGTTLSRATGLLRTLAVVYALGFAGIADDYNLANTVPNMVVDLVLGGVLSATFVPVFVDRLTSRTESEAWDALSAVTSVTLVLLGVASVVFLAAAPLIVDGLTILHHGAGAADRRLATELLVLFAPQLTCYGAIALLTALLNARRRFAAPMFVPIVNNLLLIAILVTFRPLAQAVLAPGAPAGSAAAALADHRGLVLLLGAGTTAGVVAQTLALLPSVRRAGLRLRWRPDVRHEAVRTIVQLSGWTFGLVVANQVALAVVLVLCEGIGTGAVSAYSYAWQFFQVPYAVVAVSIMSAATPALAEHWARGDVAAFRRRLTSGLRAMLAIVVPTAAAMVVLARPLIGVLGHLVRQGGTGPTAASLALLSLGLPGFCTFLYAIRVLQSIQDLRSAFWLYVLENGLTIALAVALAHPLGVRGVALAIAAAYTLSAVVGLSHVRRRVHGLGGDLVARRLGRILLATAALVVAAAAGADASGSQTGPGLALRLVSGAVAGGCAYVLVAGALAAVSGWRRHGRLDR